MATETRSSLETGWETDTPADDTILRHGVLALAATWDATARAAGGRVHRDDRFCAADVGRPTGLFNSATLLRPVIDDGVDATVGEIERFYDAVGSGAALLWCPWPIPDLAGRGWELQGHPPLLYRPPVRHVEQRRPDDLAVTDVTTESELVEWCTVAVESFPLARVDPPGTLFAPAVLEDQRFRFVIGRVGARAVAVGCHVVTSGANVLLLSTTRPDARGHGYYSALVADRLAQASNLPSVTIVSDDSRPVLISRFGFLPVSRFTLWKWPRA